METKWAFNMDRGLESATEASMGSGQGMGVRFGKGLWEGLGIGE